MINHSQGVGLFHYCVSHYCSSVVNILLPFACQIPNGLSRLILPIKLVWTIEFPTWTWISMVSWTIAPVALPTSRRGKTMASAKFVAVPPKCDNIGILLISVWVPVDLWSWAGYDACWLGGFYGFKFLTSPTIGNSSIHKVYSEFRSPFKVERNESPNKASIQSKNRICWAYRFNRHIPFWTFWATTARVPIHTDKARTWRTTMQ